MRTLLVTGGCGFIGSAFIRLFGDQYHIINIDNLSYASCREATEDRENVFEEVDIGDCTNVSRVLNVYSPDYVINFAAETHVDKSITKPEAFVETNVSKFHNLLRCCLGHFRSMSPARAEIFRFVHISTDEVYGSIDHESTSSLHYAPNSPYSASKAAGDHLVRAYWKTFGLPVITTHCTNNYGPYQFPEKLIPLMTMNAIEGQSLPLYGDGLQERDWIHVDDHCRAVDIAMHRGDIGGTYNISSGMGFTNKHIVQAICEHLGVDYHKLVKYVEDRPGHDRRYAINSYETEQLGWSRQHTMETGLPETVDWYVENKEWAERHDRERQGLP